MKSIIPNTLTSLNLACGCIAVLALLNHFYLLAITLVFVSAVADFFDGFVARLLKVQSDMGKELDSLADMVSFGFVPGAILYIAIMKSEGLSSFTEIIETKNYLPFIGFLVTVFSGIRLAKFNIDTRQSDSFIGLNTPTNTLFFITIPLIWIYEPDQVSWYSNLISNSSFLIVSTVVFSYLLIAELPFIALKFKNGFGFKDNLFRYLLIIVGVISAISFKYLSIPVILIFYILISVIEKINSKKQLS